MAAVHADVVLVGGGVASARCARTLRRRGFDGSIVLVGEEPHLPYNRPPLSKEVLRGPIRDELLLAEPPGWYDRHRVTVISGVTADRIDLERRAVSASDGTIMRFERCLVATGAVPRALPVAGGNRARTLRTIEDAMAIQAAAVALVAESAMGADTHAVVIGGGVLGVEVASGLLAMGVRPTLVELGAELWAGAFGRLLSDWAVARLRAAGAAVRLAERVTRVLPEAVEVAGSLVPAALVVAAIGVSPRAGIADSAGLATDNGIAIGADGRTEHPAVWAAGDVASVAGRGGAHWHAARESGERAALSMLGLPLPPRRSSWAFTEVLGTAVDAFGDAQPDAAEEWLLDESVIARWQAGALSQLIVIGGAIPAERARELVDGRALRADVLTAVSAAAG